MAAPLSFCHSLTLKLSQNQTSTPLSPSRCSLPLLSHSLSSLSLNSRKQPTLSFTAKSTDTEAAVDRASPNWKLSPLSKYRSPSVTKVVMVGSRQYIVFPGRYIYTQRLKGANVNDKISLNKVLVVGTKTSKYIGKPIVPNATVHAIVQEQTLDKKVIVVKYKKKKNYRRNIGHRQPITRIRKESITGYQDSPAVTLP